MRIGDADSTLWVEGAAGRLYCIEVSSRRGSSKGRPTYSWSAEEWREVAGGDGEDDDLVCLAEGTADSYEQALQAARAVVENDEQMHTRRK